MNNDKRRIVDEIAENLELDYFLKIPSEPFKRSLTLSNSSTTTTLNVTQYQSKYAKNDEEFRLIYEREFAKQNLIDSPAKHHFLRKQLIERVTNMVDKYKLFTVVKGDPLLSIADDFINFLKFSSYFNDSNIIETNELPIDNTSLFVNNFDEVDSIIVLKYFHEKLVIKGLISSLELHRYLHAAFELQNRKKVFRIKKTPGKLEIIKIFYKYYTDIAYKPHRVQPKYAALLGDYFLGFETKSVLSNFSK